MKSEEIMKEFVFDVDHIGTIPTKVMEYSPSCAKKCQGIESVINKFVKLDSMKQGIGTQL